MHSTLYIYETLKDNLLWKTKEKSALTELSCKNGIYQERGPKGPDFQRGPLNYPWA